LSGDLRHAVLNGSMVVSAEESPYGESMMQAWFQDGRPTSAARDALALSEIEHMVRRLDIEGWRIAGGMRSKGKILRGGPGRPGERVWQMLRFVDLNYMRDISVGDIASHAGLHPNYAMTVFREAMGTTLSGYLNQVRLTEAQHLLLSTRKKIFTVALESGFGSQSRFFSIFRQRFGTTPTQYRKRSVFQGSP
jgi:AraC-like DNA-binding protein